MIPGQQNMMAGKKLVFCIPSYVKPEHPNATQINARIDVYALGFAKNVASINAKIPGSAVLCDLRTISRDK